MVTLQLYFHHSPPVCHIDLICLLPLTAALSSRAWHCIPFAANDLRVCRRARVSHLLQVFVFPITRIGEDVMEAQLYPPRTLHDLLAVHFIKLEPI